MVRIPETCAPVKAQFVFEAVLDEAVQTLCQTIGARITDLLVAIVSHRDTLSFGGVDKTNEPGV